MYIALPLVAVAVSFFFLGYQVGQYVLVKKIDKIKQTLAEAMERWKSTAKLYSSHPGASAKAIGYVNQAQEIVTKINALAAQAEMPSKSATHSSWKNDIKSDMTKLDQERLELLSKAIAEGYDPSVTHEGRTEKLSVFIAEQMSRYPAQPKAKSELRLIKKPNLTLVK